MFLLFVVEYVPDLLKLKRQNSLSILILLVRIRERKEINNSFKKGKLDFFSTNGYREYDLEFHTLMTIKNI